MTYFDIRVHDFLRCVCLCAAYGRVIVRVTSSSDLSWLLEASAPPLLFCSSPLWPWVHGLHLCVSHWCCRCRVRDLLLPLGLKAVFGMPALSHPLALRRPHSSASCLLTCPTWSLWAAPHLLWESQTPGGLSVMHLEHLAEDDCTDLVFSHLQKLIENELCVFTVWLWNQDWLPHNWVPTHNLSYWWVILLSSLCHVANQSVLTVTSWGWILNY